MKYKKYEILLISSLRNAANRLELINKIFSQMLLLFHYPFHSQCQLNITLKASWQVYNIQIQVLASNELIYVLLHPK